MHFLAGWIALGCGLLNLLGRKGTSGHKALGLLFAISMCLVTIDAGSRLMAHPRVDPVVVMAVVASGATIAALLPFLARRPGWVRRHARRMHVAYVALAAAGGNEILSVQIARSGPDGSPVPASLAAGVMALIALVGAGLARRQSAEVQRVTVDFE